jgi:putative transposase
VESQVRRAGGFELVRVKELESENSRLKRMYAELALENEAIKGLLKKL